jgi:hypothetical protein
LFGLQHFVEDSVQVFVQLATTHVAVHAPPRQTGVLPPQA